MKLTSSALTTSDSFRANREAHLALLDVARQAARVLSLLEDDALHARMSAAARESAVTRFASTSIIPEYEGYYHEVLAGG